MAIVSELLLQTERSLVGAAIKDPKVFHEARLQYSQFFDPRCKTAWKHIGKVIENGKKLDEITVTDSANGDLDICFISEITMNAPVANTLYWSNIVRNQHIARGVATISADFSKWEEWGITGPEMLDKIKKKVETLEKDSLTDLPTLAAVAVSECHHLRTTPLEQLQGLPTGLGIERVVPGGIPRGKVTTLFGESGNFKTTVKNNIVLGIAQGGYRVLDVSLEDADELTAHRFIAACTGLNYGKINAYALTAAERSGLTLPKKALDVAENVIMGGEIMPNIDEIIRVAREKKPDAVVIDYVQLLESRNGRLSQKEVLDDIMRKCQLAAKRDHVAYIIVSQVKQDVDKRDNHAPRITDMIGSSAMRTASKLSLGVYRPSLYHKVPKKGSPYEKLVANHPQGKEVYEGLLELHFLKNVLGEPRVVVHCRVNPGTGHMIPFDMRNYL